MAQAVVTGATMTCSFGTTPSTLKATTNLTVMMEGKPACVIGDAKAVVNVGSFGMCSSLANPQVAAATAAALGVLTPQPCVPAITGAWIPAQTTVLVGGQPCLNQACSCVCSYAGKISIINPGQVTVSTG
ncbi:MAG: DUF4280 domain-containing protein [Lachnospiraceae bacterium]|nr:DUF4280 domain-containing protein [Lachnospiraceae bacterium]